MADISEQMIAASSAPQEAAQHIEGASIFNIGADAFKQQKDYLQPEIDKISKPFEASPTVANYVSTSPEHAALVAPDVEKLSHMDTQIKTLGDQLNGRKPVQSQIAELKAKQSDGPLSQEDEDKLFGLELDAKDYKDYGVEGPQKNKELIEKAQADLSAITPGPSTMESLWSSLNSGVSSMAAGIASMPAAAYEAYYWPANWLRASKGEPLLKTPDALANSEASKIFSEMAQEYAAKVPELNKSISEAALNGNFAEAGRIAAMQFTANLPTQAALLASAATGFGTVGLIGAGALTASQAAQENRDKGISPLRSVPDALTKGVIESAFESIGTMGFIKTWEHAMIESFGKDSAREIIKGTMKTLVFTAAGEGGEEALTSVAQDLTDYVSGVNPNALDGIGQRAADAGIIGGLSGIGTTMPVGIASGIAKSKDGKAIDIKSDIIPEKREGGAPAPVTTEEKAIETLKADSIIDNIIKVSKSAELSKLSPAQLNALRKQMFDSAKITKFFFDQEDVKAWANDEDKAKAFRDMIDPTGVLDTSLNLMSSVAPHKWVEFVEKYPDAAGLARLKAENPSISQAEKFLKDKSKAEQQRKDINAKLGVSVLTGEEKTILKEALDTTQPSDPEILGESDFLDQTTFNEAVQKIMPKVTAEVYNKAALEVRTEVLGTIKEASVYEMDGIKDVTREAAIEAQVETETAKLKSDPNLALVDRFAAGTKLGSDQTFNELRINHKKPGFSPFAIDPSTLPEKLAKKYADNEQLKKHKVFVKGGISLEDAARYVGAGSGKNLLQILSTTASRQDIIDRQTLLHSKDIEDKVNASVDIEQTSFIKNLSNSANVHMNELKAMLTENWPAAKQMFKRIANSLPTMQNIVFKAKYAINQTKIGDLNANQFKRAERTSQRLAVDAILNHEVEKAVANKLAAALNVELAKHTHIAIGKVNRIIKFARQFNKASVIQELRDAGALDAVNEILDVYLLSPDRKGTSKRNSYAKYAERVAKSGEGDITIPEKLEVIKQSMDEMTVEQVLLVGDRLKQILHQARRYNQLYAKHEKFKELAHLDRIAVELHEDAKKAYDYDPKRVDISLKENESKTWWEKNLFHKMNELRNYQERMQHLLVKMDGDKNTGKWNDALWVPLVNAAQESGKDGAAVLKQFENIIETTIGQKAFNNLASEFVDIPEFEKIKNSKDGSRFSKLQLLVMNLNRGNEGNLVALERFGISRDVFKTVLETHLTREHMMMTQRIWDTFKSFNERMSALEQRTKGVDVKFVEHSEVDFKGEIFPGGYYPIMTQFLESKYKSRELIGSIEMKQNEKFRQNMYASAMTDQGHLEARTSSEDVLTLQFGFGKAISRVIHDLNFREVIRDSAKLLEHESIKQDLISVLGMEGYRNITDTVLAHVDEIESRGNGIADQNMQGMIDYLGQGKQIMSIVGKASSIVIQLASLPLAIDKMGKVQGSKHVLRTLNLMTKEPNSMSQFYDIAEQLHPDIKHSREDLEGGILQAIADMIPTEKNALTPIKVTQEFIVEHGFAALGAVDTFNKVVVVLSAYNQALNGDADGVIKGDHTAAMNYARNIAELTQTHSNDRNKSPIMRNKSLKWALFFFNDANNMFNNMVSILRKYKKANRESLDEVTKGNIKNALSIQAAGVGGIMSSMAIVATIKIIENSLHGVKSPFDDDEDEEDPVAYAMKAGKYFLHLNIDAFLDTQPIARDVNFASEKTWMKKKSVEMPLNQVWSEFATTLSGFRKMLDFTGQTDGMSPTERKSVAKTIGIVAHLPVDGFLKTFVNERTSIFADPDEPGVLNTVFSDINKFVKKKEGVKGSSIPPKFIEDLKQIQQQIAPPSEAIAATPENALPAMSQMLSKGDWSKMGPNGEAGVYQFSEQTWKTIQQKEPDLGLTDSGRLAKDSSQQERAMRWLTGENAKELSKAGIETSVDNLYAAHILGAASAIDVLKAPGDTKLKSMVGDSFMKSYDLRNGMKVKEFKDWLLMRQVEADDKQASVDKTSK